MSQNKLLEVKYKCEVCVVQDYAGIVLLQIFFIKDCKKNVYYAFTQFVKSTSSEFNFPKNKGSLLTRMSDYNN